MISVCVSGIGPGGGTGDRIELLQEPTHDLIGIGRLTEHVQLSQHCRERLLNFADGAVRIVLTLRFQAALALDELFPVKV
jgi:hypothetical protein